MSVKCPKCNATMVPIELVGFTPNTHCVFCKKLIQDGSKGGIFYHDELGHYACKEHSRGQAYLGSVRPANS